MRTDQKIDCQKKIFIRADANCIIGTGHVMRCLSIAHVFAERGEIVTFLTADHNGDSLINSQGFKSICLNSEWTNMESELELMCEIIKKEAPSLLLIDSYYVTEDYLKNLHNTVCLAYIDDLNKACWDVDFIINYNIFGKACNYTCYNREKTSIMLGPTYAPLRDEFKYLPGHHNKRYVTDIMVSAGGADPEGITERLMREICSVWRNTCFHFIIGSLNPRLSELIKTKPENAELHINENNMAQLMRKCDIAISAAGTTLYELCAAGIPTITYVLADNQIDSANQFDYEGIMINVGDCRDNENFIGQVISAIVFLTQNRNIRKEISKKMQKLVDGLGADRIVDILLSYN